MNPAHRDRIAFLRIVSGKFERGMTVKHIRAGKEIKLSQPQQFLAQDRDIVSEAYPGDIIGLFDPGIFRIGDSLSQGGEIVFDELPTFSPEIFAKVTVKNALKHKQYQKGIDQLTEEGTIQVFTTVGFEDTLLGVVGQLQFEVFEYRMKGEYGVDVQLQRMPFQFARWIVADKIDPSKFRINSTLVKDKKGNYVALFENEYAMRTAMDKNPDAQFLEMAP
ncbi:Peptide chain release factor 3 [compost metagenome]